MPDAAAPDGDKARRMLQVTSRAAAKIKELGGDGPALVRLFITGRGCCGFRYGLAFADAIDAGSAVAEADGVRVFTDPQTAATCDGASVDYVETDGGAGFSVQNPNSAGVCTCGSATDV